MRASSKFSGVWEATRTWYTVVIIVVNGSAVFKRLVSRCVHVICLLHNIVKNRTSLLSDKHFVFCTRTPYVLTDVFHAVPQYLLTSTVFFWPVVRNLHLT